MHRQPYAAVVLKGGYTEAGEAGRWRVSAGDVLIHAPFSFHMDRIHFTPTEVLNLPLHLTESLRGGFWRVENVDMVVQEAEKDPVQAVARLMETIQPADAGESDQIDELAHQLCQSDAPAIGAWSRHQGIRRETVFRQFQAAYGVNPTQYRIESRTRQAWLATLTSATPLAEISLNCGFADQAHMSRAIKRLTGFSPGQWRRQASLQHAFKNPRLGDC
ncbi:hypothetical protein GCM10027098_13240 [Bowmanella dokdonensis]